MKNQTLKNKYIGRALLGLMLSTGLAALASELPSYAQQIGDTLVIKLAEACPAPSGTCMVNINRFGIHIKVNYQDRLDRSSNNEGDGQGYLLKIQRLESNRPFLDINTYYKYYVDESGQVKKISSDYSTLKNISQKILTCTNPEFGVTSLVFSIHGGAGSGEGFAQEMLEVSNDLIEMYKGALESINEVSQYAVDPDPQKFGTMSSNLEKALKAIIDDQGKPRYPITHWFMIENARLVLGYSEIINRDLSKYIKRPRIYEIIEPYAQTLQNLSKEIRKAYGWDQGLVGSPSRSVSTIAYIMRAVIEDILRTKESISAKDLKVLYDLKTKVDYVAIVGEANAGGDIYVMKTPQFQDFVNTWNSKDVQDQISSLLNAGRDAEGIIQPKLQLLFYVVESLNPLIGNELKVPTAAAGSTK